MITTNSKHIVITDDSIFFRVKLSDILVGAGHSVRSFSKGRELMHSLEFGNLKMDLLILDLKMPDVDGFQVLQWLQDKGYTEKFQILVITGMYELGVITKELKELGANGLMTKDFTPEQIIYRVNRVLFSEKENNRAPAKRVPVSLPADFNVADRHGAGVILNLSETGAFLHTDAELLIGSLMNLRFKLTETDDGVEVRATVKWSTKDAGAASIFGGYGVMFMSLEHQTRAVVKNYVEAHYPKDLLDA